MVRAGTAEPSAIPDSGREECAARVRAGVKPTKQTCPGRTDSSELLETCQPASSKAHARLTWPIS